MARIYISYAQSDHDFVATLVGMLEQRYQQVIVNVAYLASQPGAPEQIQRLMATSDAIVFVLTPAAVASTWVQQDIQLAELAIAANSGKQILSLVYRPVEVDAFLAQFVVIQAVGQVQEAIAQLVQQLSTVPDDEVDRLPSGIASESPGFADDEYGGKGSDYRGEQFPSQPPAPQPPASAPVPMAPPPPPFDEEAPAPATPAPPIPAVPPAPRPTPPPAPGSVADDEPIDLLPLGDMAPPRGGDARSSSGYGAPPQQAPQEQEKQKPSEKAIASAETVQFSAYHPNSLAGETWNTLLVYSYGGAALAQIQADAATFTELGSAPHVSQGQATRAIAQGTELTIEPHMEGVTFSPASDSFVWRGDWHRSMFRFSGAANLASTTQTGWIDIYVGLMIPIARIELSFPFFAARSHLSEQLPQGRMVTSSLHDTVFISYSHRDKEAFRQACDEYARFGIRVFTDEHLAAGADYEQELGRMIQQARVFHLLWSPASAHSLECRKEWAAALQREPSERFIKPWYWQQPLVTPPTEFSQYHISFRFQRLRRRLLHPATWR